MRKKIETVAMVVAALILVVSILLAISCFMQAGEKSDSSSSILVGIAFLGGGTVGAWCIYVLIEGFAVLVGNSEIEVQYVQWSANKQKNQPQVNQQSQPPIQQ